MNRPLVVVSNRGPSTFQRTDNGIEAGPPSGGLARGLRPLVAATGGAWIACAVNDADREAATLTRPDPDIDLRLVALDPNTYRRAYDDIANATLWFAHHGLWDLTREPELDDDWHRAWQDYRLLNEQIAATVVSSAPGDALVLVQDYHLALVAEHIRSARPDLALAHFSHTPFAGPEGLSVLGGEVAGELIGSMCTFDAAGFHCTRWERRFLDCARDLGLDPPVTFVSPLPPDLDGIGHLAASAECDARLAGLEEHLQGRDLVLTSGRLELSKNLLRALRAVELVCARRPDLVGTFVFAAFVYPSREGVAAYHRYRRDCEDLADTVNARFGTNDWEPVWLDTTDDLPRSIAGLRRYDAMLINPIRDGLNLVAFEGPAVNERNGAVILSVQTGAADVLVDGVLPVEPFDVADTASQIEAALDMSTDERAERAARLRTTARARSIQDWLDDHVAAISRAAPRAS